MKHFHMLSLGHFYPSLIRDVIETGTITSSRIGAVAEHSPMNIELENPLYCIVGRDGLSMDLIRAEVVGLLAGTFEDAVVRAATPMAADLTKPATAYGPRIRFQLRDVERELKMHPDSRRAVVYVGHRGDLAATHDSTENAKRAGEMPCTCLWQFLIRDGCLHMHVYMRSWDLVWGLSYDVPSFVSVFQALAYSLGVPMGKYYHTVGSGHVYERHFDIVVRPSNLVLPLFAPLYASEDGGIAKTQAEALALYRELPRATAPVS